MKIKFCNKKGNVIEKSKALKVTQHQYNLAFLNRNTDLKNIISEQVDKKIVNFIQDIINKPKAHLHSAEISREVCEYLNLPNEKLHHGLVGSLLLEKIEQFDPSKYGLKNTIVIVASKGEGQKWFYYFPATSSIQLLMNCF